MAEPLMLMVDGQLVPADGVWLDGMTVDVGAPSVPASVSARQARLALLAAGLLDTVNAAVAAAGGATQIEWDHATQIDRASPLLASIGAALSLTGEQVDELFRAASAL